MIDMQAAQLVVPLMDFIVRWTMFSVTDKATATMYLQEKAGFSLEEWQAIESFLIALDNSQE